MAGVVMARVRGEEWPQWGQVQRATSCAAGAAATGGGSAPLAGGGAGTRVLMGARGTGGCFRVSRGGKSRFSDNYGLRGTGREHKDASVMAGAKVCAAVDTRAGRSHSVRVKSWLRLGLGGKAAAACRRPRPGRTSQEPDASGRVL